MKKYLIIQPHSDDALLCCSSFIFEEGSKTVVLTVENNPKRIKEDEKVQSIIGIRYHPLGVDIFDDLYSNFFKTNGKNAVLDENNVFNFYLEKLGEEKILLLAEALNNAINKYKKKGYKIICPMGIGHPFHLLTRKLILDETDFIFYREFPHSYKRKAQEQYNNEISKLSLLKTESSKDLHDIKFEICQKAYRSQSAFFFYEKGYIEKNINEEFFVKRSEEEKHIKIYVISKDRPNGKTFDFLKRADYPYTVVVEPQDYEKYKGLHKKIEVLPENNRGFSYTVNFSKNKFDGINPIVIMDDDIMNFFYSIPGIAKISLSMKTKEELSDFFNSMDREICSTDFDYGTIGKSAFDWNYEDVSPRVAYEGSRLKYSGVPVVIIINNSDLLNISFDETLCLKSDIDFSLKCMYKNFKYAKFVHFLQQTKMNKDVKQKGGLSEVYKKTEMIQKSHKILLERWPNNIFEDTKKKTINGVCELKVKWCKK